MLLIACTLTTELVQRQIPIELGFLDDPPISPRHNPQSSHTRSLLRLADTGTDDLRVCVKLQRAYILPLLGIRTQT